MYGDSAFNYRKSHISYGDGWSNNDSACYGNGRGDGISDGYGDSTGDGWGNGDNTSGYGDGHHYYHEY